jgi:hypothetical protein
MLIFILKYLLQLSVRFIRMVEIIFNFRQTLSRTKTSNDQHIQDEQVDQEPPTQTGRSK